MFKNVASQKLKIFAFDSTTGVGKTGDAANITCYVSKDNGAVTVLGDTSATEMDATNAKGWYLFDLTQAETNADSLLFSGKSTTSNIQVCGQIYETYPASFTSFVTPTNLTAAQIATGVWQDTTSGDFTVASSIGKSLYTGNVAPGGSGGLFIAGTNAATTITTSLTTTFTGNLTGSVASVTGAVGSVTGAVGSVTGNVGGNVTGSVGSVAGAVGSVTGNVGGNVVGSVASVTAGVTLANNAVSAAALATDAGAEIADAILDRDMSTGADSGSTTVRTVRQALRFNRNKVSVVAGTMTVTKEDDATSSWTAAITTTAGDPITSIDPAGP